MKWDKAIIVLLDPNDWICRRDALAWKRRYSVPDNLCFADFQGEYGLMGFKKLEGDSLSSSNTGTKIIVVSHGSPAYIGVDGLGYYPDGVAQLLRNWGMRRVGLLAFKGCLLGKTSFLDELASSLRVEGIQFGWLLGYRHAAGQLLESSHECSGLLDAITRITTLGFCKLSDNHRVKVVKGNVHVTPSNGSSSRYPAWRPMETSV